MRPLLAWKKSAILNVDSQSNLVQKFLMIPRKITSSRKVGTHRQSDYSQYGCATSVIG
jgi:hypothetical protein